MKLSDLRVKIFADGADKAGMLEMYANPLIKGFTTNPTLMRKAGVRDYEAFGRELVELIPDRPISFEVFADELLEIERQALEVSSWGENVFVKVPITNTRGESTRRSLRRLAERGVQLNVTAIMTLQQIREVAKCVGGGRPAFASVFAGRIADTGRDPVPVMRAAVELLAPHPSVELLWASSRELLNVFQADSVGCHVITVTNDVLARLPLVGKDLREFSLETVRMFHGDAAAAGYELAPAEVLKQAAAR